jgi:hypothetical protein
MKLAHHHSLMLAWVLLGALAAGVCSLIWPAAHLRQEVIPVGIDSFYHARRILDTAADPSAFYEFDAKIHAPEGSLLVWPWGYDYAMGWLVRIGVAMGWKAEPIRLLVWLPVVAVFLSVGMILLIAQRVRLPLSLCCLAALCVALSPLTQYLHGVGFIDHHFAEYMLVLASVLCGMLWLERPGSLKRAVALGVVLGIAPAVHNALFILQIPILLTLFIHWLQDRQLPVRSTVAFAVALFLATALILVPSLPARELKFDFYLLSWFHLYVAGGTALLAFFFCRHRYSRKSIATLFIGGVLLLIPLAYQITLAKSFLGGRLELLDEIAEMHSPLRMALSGRALEVSNRYSLLVWLLPATFAFCLYQAWRDRTSTRLHYWVSAVLGIALLALQFRMHYFGSFALCIPWLVGVQQLVERWPQRAKALQLAAALGLLLMLSPSLRNQLWVPMVPAGDPWFRNVRESLNVLAKACREDPGVVLADSDMGHYIRYYTDCSVISNNFILTAQHEAKIKEMDRLLSTAAADLPAQVPLVKYVLLRPADFGVTQRGPQYQSYSTGSNVLFSDLVLRPNASPPVAPPSAYQLLYKINVTVDGKVEFPYLALYKIHVGTDSTPRGGS